MVIGVAWFKGTIGIIVKKTEQGEYKAYIDNILGNSEEEDIQRILDWGGKFPIDDALRIISKIGTIKNQEEFKRALSLTL
jgi:hypothetical protein